METIICYTSGVSRGNPGPGAVGVYITDEAGAMLCEEAQAIGNCTTDFAEYQAVLLGLQTLQSLLGEKSRKTAVELRLASELVKKQLNAESTITDPGLVPLFIEIHNTRVESFPHLTLHLITSEENSQAGQLVNEALVI